MLGRMKGGAMEDGEGVRGAERLVAFASEDEHLTAPGVRNPRDGDRNGVRRPPITTGPEPPGGTRSPSIRGGKATRLVQGDRRWQRTSIAGGRGLSGGGCARCRLPIHRRKLRRHRLGGLFAAAVSSGSEEDGHLTAKSSSLEHPLPDP